MELALLLARLLLSAVFLLSGIAKFGDPKGSIQALKDFGIPARLAPAFSLLLLAAEIVVAVALVPIALAWYGACGALSLLSIFMVVIGITMARGRNPDCHCFGKLHSSPVGWPTLARNTFLGALAAWLASRGQQHDGPALWSHLASAGENERKLFIFGGCVMCFLLFHALRAKKAAEPETATAESITSDWEDAPEPEQPPLAKRLAQAEAVPARTVVPGPLAPKPQPRDPALQRILDAGIGLPIGSPAPEFTLPNLTGQSYSLQSLRAQGKSICLVFASPYCDPCRALLHYISRWIHEHDRSLNIVVVSRGTATQNLAKLNGLEPSRVLLQQEFKLSEAYGVTSTPAAVLVGPDGLIRSQLAVGREDIARLVSSAAKPSSVEAQSEQRSA